MKTLNGLNENTVIHCKTEDEAKQVLGIIKDAGYKWIGGKEIDPEDNDWDEYKDEMCYGIYGEFPDNGLAYCDRAFYFRLNRTILPASDFIKLNTIERGCPFDELETMAVSNKIRIY